MWFEAEAASNGDMDTKNSTRTIKTGHHKNTTEARFMLQEINS